MCYIQLWMIKVGEPCVAFIYKNANIDQRVTYEGREETPQTTYQDSLERFSCRSGLRPALYIIYAFRRH